MKEASAKFEIPDSTTGGCAPIEVTLWYGEGGSITNVNMLSTTGRVYLNAVQFNALCDIVAKHTRVFP